MLNNNQIKLVQTACKVAGLRVKGFDGRYRLLLGNYLQPSGSPVKSCKQLNNMQLDDLLAICEANGWRQPGKPADFYRRKIIEGAGYASYAQREAIEHLAGDLGWSCAQLDGMIKRMTAGDVRNIAILKPGQAFKIIEALKAMFSREKGKSYSNLKQIQEDTEAVTDGQAIKVG